MALNICQIRHEDAGALSVTGNTLPGEAGPCATVRRHQRPGGFGRRDHLQHHEGDALVARRENVCSNRNQSSIALQLSPDLAQHFRYIQEAAIAVSYWRFGR